MTDVTHPLPAKFNPLPVIPEEIPDGLKRLNCFVVWRAFTDGKPAGKAAKIPVDIISGRKVSPFDPKHQMSFANAIEAYKDGNGDGIGIVLNGQPVDTAEDGSSLYLVGLDLDNVLKEPTSKAMAMQLVAEVGSYAEISPSGQGVRILCLSKHKPKSGQTKSGEIYAEKRFLTITGHRIGLNKFSEATEAVREIEKSWWDKPSVSDTPVGSFPKQFLDINSVLLGHDWKETEQNITRIREVLKWIDPDTPYETWRDCIWSLASLGWECGQELAEEWSSKSDPHWQYDDGADAKGVISSLFESFDAGKGISPGTLFYHARNNGMPRRSQQTEMINAEKDLFTTDLPSTPPLKERFRLLSRDDLDALPPFRSTIRGKLPEEGSAEVFGESNPIQKLKQFSLRGQSARLREQMLTDKFVLKNFAILGQWTNIYGAPNSGKTLLTNWLLREALLSDEIDGESVYYVNADDNYRGLVDKIELAENWGMNIIAPHHNGFDTTQIASLMNEMGHEGSARGTVFILDTLKKFTDLMDKRAASEFGNVARGFVSAGGTLIALAHTNKHLDAEGKGVYSGTSDIVDDSDCCFVIDKVSTVEQNGLTAHTVEFNNIKCRGDVASTVGFTFVRKYGQSYEALLETVKRLDGDDLDDVKGKATVQSELEQDATIIEAICTVIAEGMISKSKIVQGAHELCGKSTAAVRKVLDKRTGPIFELGHRWDKSKEAHNRHVYEILPTHKNLNN